MSARRILLLGGGVGSYAVLKALRPNAETIRICEEVGVPNACGASILADGTATVSGWFREWSADETAPSAGELRVVSELVESAKKMAATHVVAVREQLVLPLTKHHKRFREHGITLCVPTAESVQSIHDKFALYQHALAHGVAVPAMRTVREVGEALDVAKSEFGYPVIIRSDTSSGSSGVRYASNAGDLTGVVAGWFGEGRRVALSAYIEGAVEPSGILMIGRDGNMLAETWLRKIRYASASRSCCVVTSDPPPGAKRIRDLLVSIGFYGMAGIQLKWDKRTGNCVLMEINARPGQNSKIVLELWLNGGCDPGELFLNSFEEPMGKPSFTLPAGLVGVSIPEDAMAFLRALVSSKRKARIDNPMPSLQTITKSFVDSYFRYEFTVDSVSRSVVTDPRFFLKSVPALLGRIAKEPLGLTPWGDIDFLSRAGAHG